MEKNKGKIQNYNKIPVKQREYYYDREETDKDIRKDFSDMMMGLKDLNKKIKKETEKEQTPKLKIDLGEGLLSQATWINNVSKAQSEFKSYKANGGRVTTLELFLKKAISLIKSGKKIAKGKDVADDEKGKTPKSKIDLGEGLLSQATWINNVSKAQGEFKSYKANGGKAATLEIFLKKAISLIKSGKKIAKGKDVANSE